jgi:hypothetical protein
MVRRVVEESQELSHLKLDNILCRINSSSSRNLSWPPLPHLVSLHTSLKDDFERGEQALSSCFQRALTYSKISGARCRKQRKTSFAWNPISCLKVGRHSTSRRPRTSLGRFLSQFCIETALEVDNQEQPLFRNKPQSSKLQGKREDLPAGSHAQSCSGRHCAPGRACPVCSYSSGRPGSFEARSS